MAATDAPPRPQIAVIGAGIFVRTQYVPRLRELADVLEVKAVWSRTEESARAVAELVREFSPDVECKWGNSGIDEIAGDRRIDAVAIVLAAQVQVDVSLKFLKAGKHVIQEKPAAQSSEEAKVALSNYNSFQKQIPNKTIWAVAENYRFEPVFVESRKLINNIGDMMNVQVIAEGAMNSSNPYFNSSWRRNFAGGFILDMGVHYIAALRTLVGCEVTTVSSISRHVDTNLPPPDNISSLFQLENGCAGVFVMAVNSRSPKILWRVSGTKGALEVQRSVDSGKHGYSVIFFGEGGQCQNNFYPFSGVNKELKAFAHDILLARNQNGFTSDTAEPRSAYIEGARDVAVLEAMMESSAKQGAPVNVKTF